MVCVASFADSTVDYVLFVEKLLEPGSAIGAGAPLIGTGAGPAVALVIVQVAFCHFVDRFNLLLELTLGGFMAIISPRLSTPKEVSSQSRPTPGGEARPS